jgi:hypothetical protein
VLKFAVLVFIRVETGRCLHLGRFGEFHLQSGFAVGTQWRMMGIGGK